MIPCNCKVREEPIHQEIIHKVAFFLYTGVYISTQIGLVCHVECQGSVSRDGGGGGATYDKVILYLEGSLSSQD